MTRLSTHVLDAASGLPAHGVEVILSDQENHEIADATTDSDGRVFDVAGSALPPGRYRLIFNTGKWFVDNEIGGFYPEVSVCFDIKGSENHLHIPLLLSPYAYSTYRGS